MSSTAVHCLCWTSLLVQSRVAHPISIKPAFQGVGSVPGESAECNDQVNAYQKKIRIDSSSIGVQYGSINALRDILTDVPESIYGNMASLLDFNLTFPRIDGHS